MMSDWSEGLMGEAPEVPAAAARALALVNELYAQSKNFNVTEFEDEIEQALWCRTEPGSLTEEDQLRQRAQAQHWAMRELAAFSATLPLAEYHLQIVLTTLSVSSTSDRAVMDQIPREIAQASLIDGLMTLMERVNVGIRFHRADEQKWRDDTKLAGRDGDYRSLGHLIRHLELHLAPDIRLAMMLLTKLAPARLADYIVEKKDVLLSVAVRDTLNEDAPKFALSVTDVTFKYVCVSRLADKKVANSPTCAVETVCALILQVAQTDLWRNWIADFAHYPQGDTVGETALSGALSQLSATQWSDFIAAIELWTLPSTAVGVTKILLPFFQALGEEASAPMWRLAFERWDNWDYGSSEPDNNLLAPATCSLDFPVIMHYATIPLHETEAEEASLRDFIATVEQEWFVDLLALSSTRNRAASRLRLVQHGLIIRNHSSETVDALPPPIEPKNEFERVRYRYFDPHAERSRRR